MVYFSAAFYYVRYSILGEILKHTFSRFQPKLWLITIGFLVLYFLHQLQSVIFRLLDEIFFPAYRKVKIKEPVFIIASPRSGTTYLHRLIALDEERFTYTKFAHTFFMSTTFVMMYKAARWIDRKMLGKLISKTFNKIDSKLWGGWDDIHALGFNKAEEDELIFAQSMLSIGTLIPFPFFDTIHGNKILDNEPEDVRHNMMEFYESSLKRFVYGYDKNKTYLVKNVMSSGRFKSILQRFPDAKIIYIARNPYEAVPSMTSMFTVMYDLPPAPAGGPHPAITAWSKLSIDLYKCSKEMRKIMPTDRFIQLKYDDLLQDPQGTVLKVYNQFNWVPSEKFLERLSKEERRNATYTSKHDYSLEQYGLTRQHIYSELGDVMDEFGFAKEF